MALPQNPAQCPDLDHFEEVYVLSNFVAFGDFMEGKFHVEAATAFHAGHISLSKTLHKRKYVALCYHCTRCEQFQESFFLCAAKPQGGRSLLLLSS